LSLASFFFHYEATISQFPWIFKALGPKKADFSSVRATNYRIWILNLSDTADSRNSPEIGVLQLPHHSKEISPSLVLRLSL